MEESVTTENHSPVPPSTTTSNNNNPLSRKLKKILNTRLDNDKVGVVGDVFMTQTYTI